MKMHNVNARNRFNGIFDLQIHSLGFSGSEVVSSFHRLCDNEAQTNEISLTISFYQNINFQTIFITLLRFFIIPDFSIKFSSNFSVFCGVLGMVDAQIGKKAYKFLTWGRSDPLKLAPSVKKSKIEFLVEKL